MKDHSGRDIQPITKPLHSMDEMHAWNAQNIGDCFNSSEGRRMLIKATFTQAKEDGVTLRLFQSGCLKAEELDDIRKNGLKKI